MKKRDIIIGTRGSRLALWQANHIKSALSEKDPSVSIRIEVIKTKGDKILDVPLAVVGGKGLFVKEIEEALLDGRIDIAVHSMKDMPAEIPEGLCIGCVPEREDPDDVLISRDDVLFADLKPEARIGTSSLRRAAQLLHARTDLNIVSLRGNIDTRLRKLDTENLDAIILAYAGVRRMNYESRISERLDYALMLPAAGQGALCIEIREDDREIQPFVALLDHKDTHLAVRGERAFLHHLEGSCQVPIAAAGKIENNQLIMDGLVADLDGRTIIRDTSTGPADRPEPTGVTLAEKLLDRGACDILKQLTTGESKINER